VDECKPLPTMVICASLMEKAANASTKEYTLHITSCTGAMLVSSVNPKPVENCCRVWALGRNRVAALRSRPAVAEV